MAGGVGGEAVGQKQKKITKVLCPKMIFFLILPPPPQYLYTTIFSHIADENEDSSCLKSLLEVQTL